MSSCFASQVMQDQFGAGWLEGGKLSLKLVNVLWVDETRDARARRSASGSRRGPAPACTATCGSRRTTARASRSARRARSSRGAPLGSLRVPPRALRGGPRARAAGPAHPRRVLGGRRLDGPVPRPPPAGRRARAGARPRPRPPRSAGGRRRRRRARPCVALGARFGAPVLVDRLEPGALRGSGPSRTRLTLQEAARCARYRALAAQAERAGAERIATAHNRDDQAETVLLRLLRGAGPEALGGIPERSPDGRIVRPLLGVGRSRILEHARAAGLSWREDASNESRSYARNRLRHDWLPGLEQAFNPRLLRAVADLAEAVRRDGEWIAASVEAEARAVDDARRGGALDLAGPLERAARGARPPRGPACAAPRRRRPRPEPAHLLRILAFLRGASPGHRHRASRRPRPRPASARGFRLGPAACRPRGSC